MIILLSFAALVFVFSGIAGVVYYDQIIIHMYDKRRDLWTEVGMPPGVLRKPTLPPGFFESSAQTFMLKLTFSTPECLYSDEELRALIKKYKTTGVVCLIAAVLLFFVVCVVW